jgi:hypothetical protein
VKIRAIAAVFGAMLMVAPAASAASDEFTGSFSWGPESGEGQWEQASVEFTDPRLQGRVVMTANPEQIEDDGVYVYSFRIENEDGAWQGEPVTGVQFNGAEYGTSVHLLAGEGVYEGLSAVAEVSLAANTFQLRGLILDVPIPEL